MTIKPLDLDFAEKIKEKINNKTKPMGSLGQLEALALQLALLQNQQHCLWQEQLAPLKPVLVVFAGDHGISDEGVSIAPSSVTRQMVINFLQGGAAINCFCRSNNIVFNVVDCGLLEAIAEKSSMLITQRLGAGTYNFSRQPAMSLAQVETGLSYGDHLVAHYLRQGHNILLLGEMGIANTSSAAALMAALTSYSVEDCVGYGTGISSEQYQHKLALIKQALARLTGQEKIPELLSQLGGFEIVQLVGVIVAAAKQGLPVMIDGFIVSVAALLASKLEPNVLDYLIFSHQSDEKGHQLLLTYLQAKPLLSLGLRLGEGTGAALAFPLLTAAVSFYNDMATFDSAGVTV